MHSAKKEKATNRRFFHYGIAASVVIMMFASASYFFWNQNQNLQKENTLVTNQIKYLEDQKFAFEAGRTPPDFPPNHSEENFEDRATPDDLDVTGRTMMGF